MLRYARLALVLHFPHVLRMTYVLHFTHVLQVPHVRLATCLLDVARMPRVTPATFLLHLFNSLL